MPSYLFTLNPQYPSQVLMHLEWLPSEDLIIAIYEISIELYKFESVDFNT